MASDPDVADPDLVYVWDRVEIGEGPDACWLWTGVVNSDGYGYAAAGACRICGGPVSTPKTQQCRSCYQARGRKDHS